MKTRVLILCCLLMVPAVRAQQTNDAGNEDEDPFAFLRDDNNTVTSDSAKPTKAAPVKEPPAPRPQAAGADEATTEDPFAFLLEESSTVFSSLTPSGQAPIGKGKVELGVEYVSQDNFTLGRYNGLYEQGFLPILNADYRDWLPMDGATPLAWNLFLQDVGTEVAEGSFSVSQPGQFRVSVSFDEQLQVSNDTGATPFRGNSYQQLPGNWVASNTTAGMTALDDSLGSFNQKLARDIYSFNYLQAINRQWSVETTLSTEKKQGRQTTGAAFYIDGSDAFAAILSEPINQTTNEFDLSLRYNAAQLHMDLSYRYSSYENNEPGLQWQNPYDANFGPDVDYPNGYGQMGVTPDNDLNQLRWIASYQFSPTVHTYADASFARARQDDGYLPYTINPNLVVTVPPPRSSLDGEVDTTVVNTGVILRPLAKLHLELKYHYYDRDNDSPRDGYLYPPGDSFNQPNSEFTIYNSPYDITKNRFEANSSYRLPGQTRLSLDYRYENISRYNAAVSETDENTLEAGVRFLPMRNSVARFSLAYSDREASTYNWGQSYYSMLDTELINLTPDTERYTNHPLLSQYYLASRERWQAKFNLNYLASEQWNHNLDLAWDDQDYDQTDLGLEREKHANATFSSSYMPNDAWSISAYYSFDYYETKQQGRAFRGGAEKNAFAIFPPLPQASDPLQDWRTDPESLVHAFGLNVSWDVRPDELDMVLDYSFVDTTIKQGFQTNGTANGNGSSLPDDSSQLHHLQWDANYYYSKRISLKMSYQYYYFNQDNWAIDNVNPDTMDTVLFTGEQSPDDSISVVGLSVIYQLP